MKSYIYSVLISTLVFAIILIIIPKNKMTNFIKGVMLTLLCVNIISPMFNFDFEFNFNEEKVINNDIQSEYVDFTFNKKTELVSDCVKSYLDCCGIVNAKVNVESKNSENSFEIKKITINLENAVMNSEYKHIDIKEEVVELIKTRFGIENTEVSVIEKQ